MTFDLKKIALTVLGLILTGLFPVVAQPYVLQGPHILELMAEKLGQAQSLSVSQRVIFYNTLPQPQAVFEKDSGGESEEAANRPEHGPTTLHEFGVRQPGSLSKNEGPDEVNDEVNASGNLSAGPPAAAIQTASPPVLPETIQLAESLKYIFSEAFRSDIVSDSNQRVYLFNKGQSITVIDGTVSDDGDSQFDVYKDLLLYRSREMLSERLSNLGIDISVSSLGKFDGRLALVIGAEFPDASVPQVWLDKESFLPLRILIFGTKSPYNAGRGFLEIRYTNWQRIGKISYPMKIEFIQDGATVRAIEVDSYKINPSFSKDLFDIARLKLKYRQPIRTPDHQGKGEGLSEVQKTIEEFRKIFE